MKKILEISLGITTSVGGFLEIGSIATAAQAGAAFGYQLIWAVVLGTTCVAVLVEMSGRFAAVSGHTIPDAMRERFGATVFALPFMVMLAVTFLVLIAELGGVAVALEMATGVRFPWWAIPAAFVAWALLWRGTFGLIEKGVSILGLVTVAFAVAAVQLHPNYGEVARGALPTFPKSEAANYWFLAVSILGASISPYLYYFYCSGVIEDKWDESYLATNRFIAGLGMAFGGFLSVAIIVIAALVFKPAGIQGDQYNQLPLLLIAPLGKAGFWLFGASLGIACLGATLEVTLSLAYFIAQGLGWNWGKDVAPDDDARFSLGYTLIILLAAPIVALGIDPLKITMLAMALTATMLPLGTFPFLILMNDKQYLREHTNKSFGNIVVLVISIVAAVLGVVSIPLEIIGG
jgi:Mn2+/Fe2+ NRAMP family transporter